MEFLITQSLTLDCIAIHIFRNTVQWYSVRTLSPSFVQRYWKCHADKVQSTFTISREREEAVTVNGGSIYPSEQQKARTGMASFVITKAVETPRRSVFATIACRRGCINFTMISFFLVSLPIVGESRFLLPLRLRSTLMLV